MTRRIVLVATETLLAFITLLLGVSALMFVESGMAAPAAAYAFVAGVLTVRLVARLWRWLSA